MLTVLLPPLVLPFIVKAGFAKVAGFAIGGGTSASFGGSDGFKGGLTTTGTSSGISSFISSFCAAEIVYPAGLAPSTPAADLIVG